MTTIDRPVGRTLTSTDQPKLLESRRGIKINHWRVLTSELIKLGSLRSTVWALLATVAVIMGGGAFAAVGIVVQNEPPAAESLAADPSGGTLSGVGYAQLAVIVFGVIAVTGEYRTRMIRSSMAAVPNRLPLVWGKAAVVAAASAISTLAALIGTFVVADKVMAVQNLSISLTTPGMARALVGAALALGITAAMATGIGWVLRNTAGAVAALFVLLYVIPSFAALLPPAVARQVAPYLPSSAVGAVTQVGPAEGLLSAWAGFGVYACYAVFALAAAAVAVRRRDA
ncbi:MAG TPA: hypothetical protein VFP89_04580 [Propionibacteriaceae bacterium]|nr:hypothetical protein [Propionibacteriaceae bacterium]